ncbi:hypothetical protein A6A25_26295 [Saccharothrix sp. CB00851]|nr:hypothetical protein A6A25_26295 [Saccharothrix sp. CB00851]
MQVATDTAGVAGRGRGAEAVNADPQPAHRHAATSFPFSQFNPDKFTETSMSVRIPRVNTGVEHPESTRVRTEISEWELPGSAAGRPPALSNISHSA